MARYLPDTSAWNRAAAAAGRWRALLRDHEVLMCTPVALELLYSTRGKRDYGVLAAQLARLTHAPLDERSSSLASRRQAALAERSQHRGPTAVDLLVASIAERSDAILLHYDRHFDSIARVSGQPMEWLAARGSLD